MQKGGVFPMKHTQRLCYGCMAAIPKDAASCPFCSFNTATHTQNPRCLLPGTTLQARYIVGKVIGEGGFGITYIGFDSVSEDIIAIKEYFPAKNATRDCVKNGTNQLYFFKNKNTAKTKEAFDNYIKEAKTLHQFSYLDGIVSTKDFFFENNTAYIIMEYVDGITLKEYLRTNGTISPKETFELMMPVMLALEKIHEKGIVHRDISPDNIMIRLDGAFKLIDFGAARVNNEDDGSSLTIILKRGFAPEEQYRQHGKQGPWTDVYALCATMYQMLTNTVPPEAMERLVLDKLVPLTDFPISITQEQSDAIQKGLSVKAKDRFSSIRELRLALTRKKLPVFEHELHMIATLQQANGLIVAYRLFDPKQNHYIDFPKDQLLDAITKNELTVNNLIVYQQYIQPVGGSIQNYPVLNSDGELQSNDHFYFIEYIANKGYYCLNYKGTAFYYSEKETKELLSRKKFANKDKVNVMLTLHTQNNLSLVTETTLPELPLENSLDKVLSNSSQNVESTVLAANESKKLSLVTNYSKPLSLTEASPRSSSKDITRQIRRKMIQDSKQRKR